MRNSPDSNDLIKITLSFPIKFHLKKIRIKFVEKHARIIFLD